ncbi:MAG: hypothetical protein ACE5GD_03795 [Candidatus Geothermarchaeales archaeon]
MKRILKIFTIFIVITGLISPISVFGEVDARWITKSEIKEVETGKVVGEGEPLLTGGRYAVRVEITMPMQADIEVVAYTEFEWDEVGSLWNVVEDKNKAVGSFDPRLNQISFVPKAKDVKLVLDIVGRVPREITMKKVDNLILHLTTKVKPIRLELRGGLLDHIEKVVIDSNIATYNNKLEQKRGFLDEIRDEVDEKWFSLTSGMVSYSESLAANGFTDMASEILDLVPSSRDEVPLKPVEKDLLTANMPYMGMGVLGILAVVGLVQWSRARSRSSDYEYVLKEQVKKLEVLRIRGKRLDPRFASELGELKETIKKTLEGE